MKRALIGHTGFVGGNLLKSFDFNELYNSKNIDDIEGKKIDQLFIAAPSAVKWLANKKPIDDLSSIQNILEKLQKVDAKEVILFSTVDVYGDNVKEELNESYTLNLDIHPYGRNRAIFESYIKSMFEAKIIRLPALFGENLKKNIIFDLLNDKMLENISLKTSFQWFDLSDLKEVVEKVTNEKISLFNCVTEPISTEEIIDFFFSEKKYLCKGSSTAQYHLTSLYCEKGYMYDKENMLSKLRSFLDVVQK